MNVAVGDLNAGCSAYVEVEHGEPHGILRSITYISDAGADCPACGICDGLVEVRNGFMCTDCGARWYRFRLPE